MKKIYKKLSLISLGFIITIIFFPSMVKAAPAFVQACSNEDGGVNSITCSFSGGATANNIIAVYVGWFSQTNTLTSFSSSCVAGGFTILDSTKDTRGSTIVQGYGIITSNGNCTVTANFSGSQTANITAQEISGIDTANALDNNQHSIFVQGYTSASVNSAKSNSLNTTINGDYIFSAIIDSNLNNTSFTAGTQSLAYTMPAGSAQSGFSTASEYAIQPTAGSVYSSFTPNNSGYSTIGIIAFRSSISTLPDTAPPSTPTNLSATAISSSQINLSWTASTDPSVAGQATSGVSGYKIYRNGSQITTTSNTSFSDSGLLPSTSYSYTVSAYDAAGNTSSQSSSVSATTQAPAPTLPVINSFSASPSSITSGNSSTLSWSVSNATSLSISGIGTVTGTSRNVSPTNTTTYTLTATNATGNVTANTTVTVTQPDTTAPSVPTNLSATAISSSQINLSWTTSSDNVAVTGYKIYRNGSQITTTSNTSYSDSSLLPATSYSYTISAYDAANNNSAQSSSANATTQAAPPQGTYPWSNILSSSRAVDWSSAGVTGGIPNRTTICATFNSGATASQINSAIASCNNGVVKLNAGTYNLNSGITFNGKSNVTLRGDGADKTFLKFTGANGCQGRWTAVCIQGNDLGYYGLGPPTHVVNWTSGYAKDTNQITLSATTGLSVGMYIVLDQLDDSTDTGNIYVCSSTSCTHEGGGGNGRPSRGNRQMTLVTAINGNTVTISPGIYMPNFRSSQSPQAWWGNSGSLSYGDGVEDLSIDGSNGGATISNIELIMTHDSWVKGVRSVNAPSPQAHIELYQAAHCTVRDSYIVGSVGDAGHSTNYGIDTYGTANILAENNIGQHRTPLIIANGDQGSVYGYNFAIDDHYDSPLTFMQLSNYSHEVGNGMNLHEGNSGIGIDGDVVHGTSNLVTSFRNYMVGWETGKIYNTNPTHIYANNRYYSFVGNVFGKAGYHDTYQGNSATSIWVLGDAYNTVPSDPLVATTAMRWGNYDTVTGTVRWNASEVPSGIVAYPNPVPLSQTLPTSFYLSSKPVWWGSIPWPAIGPEVVGGNISGVGGHANKIPAQVCWESMTADPAYSGDPASVKIFNPSSCYSSSGAITTYTLTSTSGSGGTITPSGITTVNSGSSQTFTITPNTGYQISSVTVDGTNQGSITSYTFSNVTSNHTISATFSQTTTPPSTTFTTNDRVYTNTTGVNIRNNPGTTGTTILGTHTTNDLGTILGSAQNGTYADGYYWWNVNFDSGVDGWVAEPFLTRYTAPILGDLNSDGLVNSIDLSLLTSKWNQSYAPYDLNGDGTINSLDYAILSSHWSP